MKELLAKVDKLIGLSDADLEAPACRLPGTIPARSRLRTTRSRWTTRMLCWRRTMGSPNRISRRWPTAGSHRWVRGARALAVSQRTRWVCWASSRSQRLSAICPIRRPLAKDPSRTSRRRCPSTPNSSIRRRRPSSPPSRRERRKGQRRGRRTQLAGARGGAKTSPSGQHHPVGGGGDMVDFQSLWGDDDLPGKLPWEDAPPSSNGAPLSAPVEITNDDVRADDAAGDPLAAQVTPPPHMNGDRGDSSLAVAAAAAHDDALLQGLGTIEVPPMPEEVLYDERSAPIRPLWPPGTSASPSCRGAFPRWNPSGKRSPVERPSCKGASGHWRRSARRCARSWTNSASG